MFKSLLIILAIILLQVACQNSQTSADQNRLTENCVKLFLQYADHKDLYQSQFQNVKPGDYNPQIKNVLIRAVNLCQNIIKDHKDGESFFQGKDNGLFTQHHTVFETLSFENPEFAQNYTSQQQNIITLAEKFYEENSKNSEPEQEIIFLGYNLKKLPPNAKYYYLTVYALITITILYFSLKQLDKQTKERTQ